MSFTLEELEYDILECNKCDLGKTANKRVIMRSTSQTPEILFIGEAPGAEENRTGKPFVGRSGKVLDEMIKYMEIEDYAIINRLKCHPEKNANPTPAQLESCYPFLLRQIELFNPALIILLGKYANEGFGPKLKWGVIKEDEGRFYAKLYHPAALLYNVNLRNNQFKYMDTIKDLLPELKAKRQKKLKSCEICGESFMGTPTEKTCCKCEFKPMYPDKESADEFVYG